MGLGGWWQPASRLGARILRNTSPRICWQRCANLAALHPLPSMHSRLPHHTSPTLLCATPLHPTPHPAPLHASPPAQNRAVVNLFKGPNMIEDTHRTLQQLERGDLKLRVRALEAERALARVAVSWGAIQAHAALEGHAALLC